jgi:iron(III) transport system substrate-binding protein
MTERNPDTGTGRRRDRTGANRRRFLAGVGAAGLVGLAGCSSSLFGDEDPSDDAAAEFGEFRGSGPLAEDRTDLGGERIADLPDLSGELMVYLGGGEGGLYRDLIAELEEIYPEFTVTPRDSGTADAANTIIGEGEQSPADVFWSVDAGSLSAVASEGLTASLPAEVVDPVPDEFHPDDAWVGTAGRARAVPYNSDVLSADDVPDTVMYFPESDDFAAGMGWAPTYGSFQAFVTAMRLTEGESATRDWLEAMVDAGVTEYNNEFLVSNAVADGELDAGFANHYYALRVQASRPDAPLELAFTSGDAGALINVAGAAVLESSDERDLATAFVRHLLSAEAQEFFATRTYAYPMVSGIPPVGGLPSIEELDPPALDLSKLSDLQPTLELMREVGVL